MKQDEDSNRANLSRFKQIAIRGDEYEEEVDYNYRGEELSFYISPLKEQTLLPLQTLLMEKMGMDLDDAEEKIDNADPSDLDEEFVSIMQKIAILGLVPDKGDLEGTETEEGIKEIIVDIGLIGGFSLEIAQDVINISSDAETAEKFRRDGGRE